MLACHFYADRRAARDTIFQMTSPPLKDLLEVAVEAAYAGGRRTLAYFNTGVAVRIDKQGWS